MRFGRRENAQTFLEYSLLIGIVVAVLMAMAPMLRRSTQAMIKVVSDQVGDQVNSEQEGGDQGHLDSANTITRVDRQISTIDRLGTRRIDYDKDSTFTDSSVIVNQGFRETN